MATFFIKRRTGTAEHTESGIRTTATDADGNTSEVAPAHSHGFRGMQDPQAWKERLLQWGAMRLGIAMTLSDYWVGSAASRCWPETVSICW